MSELESEEVKGGDIFLLLFSRFRVQIILFINLLYYLKFMNLVTDYVSLMNYLPMKITVLPRSNSPDYCKH